MFVSTLTPSVFGGGKVVLVFEIIYLFSIFKLFSMVNVFDNQQHFVLNSL